MLLIVALLLFSLLIYALGRNEFRTFQDPVTNRTFVAERHVYFSRGATYHERNGIFLHSSQTLRGQGSMDSQWNSRPWVVIDANGIHPSFVGPVDSQAVFLFTGGLDWAGRSFDEIVLTWSGAGANEIAAITLRQDYLLFTQNVNSLHLPFELRGTTIPITSAQYQELRSQLAEAPLVSRAQDNPQYRIHVQGTRRNTYTQIVIDGEAVFHTLLLLKGA